MLSQTNFTLYSPTEVTSLLSHFGTPSECTQIENGTFKANINITTNKSITKVTFKANKKCLVTGDKPESKIQFSYGGFQHLSENDLPKNFDSTISKSTIAGFGNNREAHATIPAGLEVVYFSLPKIQLLQYAANKGFESFLELTDKTNHIDLKNANLLAVKQGLNSLIYQSQQTTFSPSDLLSLLSPHQLPSKVKLHNRFKIAHQFVRWCHNHVEGEPACLDRIAKELFVSRRTLILAIQDHFDQGPAELLKSMRLQHCHQGLIGSKHYPNQRSEPLSVSQVMEIYGFKHRGSFAKSFKDYFGYAPSETINQFQHLQ